MIPSRGVTPSLAGCWTAAVIVSKSGVLYCLSGIDAGADPSRDRNVLEIDVQIDEHAGVYSPAMLPKYDKIQSFAGDN